MALTFDEIINNITKLQDMLSQEEIKLFAYLERQKNICNLDKQAG